MGEILHYWYITCSPMDPLQWMGAVRMRGQTDDKNITIIHTTPVPHLMPCEAKSFMFVWIIVMFLSADWTLTAPIHCRGSIGEQVM